MRVHAGRKLRVGPGDEVVVQARLPSSSPGLGRLFVFAREGHSGQFSPYVPHAGDVVSGTPQMVTPMAIRLTKAAPVRELRFESDIDGFIRLMQEVDSLDEPSAKVRLKRKINPTLDWKQRMRRRMGEIFWWKI